MTRSSAPKEGHTDGSIHWLVFVSSSCFNCPAHALGKTEFFHDHHGLFRRPSQDDFDNRVFAMEPSSVAAMRLRRPECLMRFPCKKLGTQGNRSYMAWYSQRGCQPATHWMFRRFLCMTDGTKTFKKKRYQVFSLQHLQLSSATSKSCL